MPRLVPVDHDPFEDVGPQLVPVDHDPFPPRSALDASGMGAFTPPDTFVGRAAEAAMAGMSSDPEVRRQATDFAMGLVGPGSIKGVGPTLGFKSAGAVRGGGAAEPIAPNRIDRPPTAKELREAAQYERILAEGRARAEARKAAQAGAQPPPPTGETLNYQSAGAGRGQAAADPLLGKLSGATSPDR